MRAKDIEVEDLKIEKNALERQLKLLERNFESLKNEKNRLLNVLFSIKMIEFLIYLQLAEEIATENNELKKNKLKNLSEENENLRKTLHSLRMEIKKHGKITIDLQERLAYFENAYNDITMKFQDSHFTKLEKLYNLKFLINPTFSDIDEESLNQINSNPNSKNLQISNEKSELKQEKQYKNLQEILEKKPQEKSIIKGRFKC